MSSDLYCLEFVSVIIQRLTRSDKFLNVSSLQFQTTSGLASFRVGSLAIWQFPANSRPFPYWVNKPHSIVGHLISETC